MSKQPSVLAAERHFSLSRRQFFRAAAGACIALPVFASVARAVPRTAPRRMAFLYVPNGTIPSAWWPQPAADGAFTLSPTLMPLEKVRRSVQVIAGLEDVSADPGLDGAGDHARACGTFLTGVRIKKTAGSDIHSGISIDQAVADQIGHLTRFSSLELTCENIRKAGDCDSGYACAYAYNLSWRSANQPLSPEPNPRFVFERLFGAGAPRERVANLRKRQQEQHSILDYVLEDARSLEQRLDGRDRQKLDQYLTSIRDIERRIENSEKLPVRNPEIEAPAGVPESYGEHIALMCDMLLLAFQTDSTRIATVTFAPEGSNRSFADIGIAEGHHNLTHHKNEAQMIDKVKEIDRWYVQRLATFLEKMDATQDVDGNSLLHNSMVMYGSGNADGNRHSHVNLPIMLAGAGGGAFKPGRTLDAGGKPITNLYLTMAAAMGAPSLTKHGDSTGHLTV